MRITYAVWELTLKCNLACRHCGSRAAEARDNELSTAEALDLVRQLAEVGIKEVTLIGGEAYLRHDWLTIARAISDLGMTCSITTGGYGLSFDTVSKMKPAGIALVSVSVDGLAATHDHLRGRAGSWQSCFRTMKYLRQAGLKFSCNTQINRLSAPELPLIYQDIRDAGSIAWQIQLTVPMGNAADNWEILLQPSELLDLFPMLARLVEESQRDGVRIFPGNNIGYYGPYERLLRGGEHQYSFWTGCSAGLATLGIEANGDIKGCPSLPTDQYVGGNIRQRSLRSIILESEELQITQGAGTAAGTAHLWGFCQSCEFAAICRGGCNWTAHVFFDRRGNNPYCHHRALTQMKRGRRERLSLQQAANGVPFDNGIFAISEEDFHSPWPVYDPLHFTAQDIRWKR